VEYFTTEYSIHSLTIRSGIALNEDGGTSDLVGAQGKMVVFIASLLQRAGVARMDEFGELLTVFADTVAETEPGEGAILRHWASALRGNPVA
jgi:hypothetical protein